MPDYSGKFCFVCLIWFFTSPQQSFSYKGTGLSGLNQYARINVLAQGQNAVTQVSGTGQKDIYKREYTVIVPYVYN